MTHPDPPRGGGKENDISYRITNDISYRITNDISYRMD
jgi:hypothetical protein